MTTDHEAAPIERGVIEGFYGRPFSHEQRLGLIRFIGAHGFNCYAYAPKNDPLHRERWRDPYPADEIARFRALSRCRGRAAAFDSSTRSRRVSATTPVTRATSSFSRPRSAP